MRLVRTTFFMILGCLLLLPAVPLVSARTLPTTTRPTSQTVDETSTLCEAIGAQYLESPAAPNATCRVVIRHQGLLRFADVYFPQGYAANSTVPLWLHFHGLYRATWNIYSPSNSGLDHLKRAAEHIAVNWGVIDGWLRDKAVHVYPDSTQLPSRPGLTPGPQLWNSGFWQCPYSNNPTVCIDENVDDVGFLELLTQHLLARLPSKPQHVYAMGFSNGGMIISRMLCESTYFQQTLTAASLVGTVLSKPYMANICGQDHDRSTGSNTTVLAHRMQYIRPLNSSRVATKALKDDIVITISDDMLSGGTLGGNNNQVTTIDNSSNHVVNSANTTSGTQGIYGAAHSVKPPTPMRTPLIFIQGLNDTLFPLERETNSAAGDALYSTLDMVDAWAGRYNCASSSNNNSSSSSTGIDSWPLVYTAGEGVTCRSYCHNQQQQQQQQTHTPIAPSVMSLTAAEPSLPPAISQRSSSSRSSSGRSLRLVGGQSRGGITLPALTVATTAAAAAPPPPPPALATAEGAAAAASTTPGSSKGPGQISNAQPGLQQQDGPDRSDIQPKIWLCGMAGVAHQWRKYMAELSWTFFTELDQYNTPLPEPDVAP